MRTGGSLNTTAPVASSVQNSSWHSPVPYLFGGLAAMMGLIAFALLILACSYWKLSGYFENTGESEERRDLENAEDKGGETIKGSSVFEEKIVVIMAGDEKPTFLATPISSRASSFGDNKSDSSKKENEKSEKSGKEKQETVNHEQTRENGVTQLIPEEQDQ
ncbi:hypothetical protein HHK36_031694 [Tetracentron sinense]|uniref:Uncharacterized protein n=1 Tax=Tetracentron sinense TaxID=13715 RepID=A0A834Y8Q9_TETSI|nr:hypothetical protein HHK36_031694 [Tetracentron sinense]